MFLPYAMRLLNAETKKLEEFPDDETIPPYAILSHTWGSDELTYDAIAISSDPFPPNTKIDGRCEIALSDGLRYVWIDTICIDKSSSAELSEAINSRVRWYKDSSVCYTREAVQVCR